jgi:hypothetical protein
MPRPRKAIQVRRIELRLAADDPLLQELAQEAELRGVELTHHIHDLLRNRYLIRHGHTLTELLWIGKAATVELPLQATTPDLGAAPNSAAGAAANAWTDLLNTDEA